MHKQSVPERIDKEKLTFLLKKVNHPGRYIGAEPGTSSKAFKDATVKAILAFPDLYEIGISNFGLKILYELINNIPEAMVDRVYAPDKDFRDQLISNELPLYGLESFVPVKKFDIVAFSMQYELNYVTVLAMLELSGIPVYQKDRSIDDPIIVAGGPSCFNPEPFADFFDAILIGDGEELVIDLINKVSQIKKEKYSSRKAMLESLVEIQGVYIPSLYKIEEKENRHVAISEKAPVQVFKRFSELKKEDHPVNVPIPLVSVVHDRSMVEIRRGCGRMCRFCQACFVNLPVRERPAEEVKQLCRDSLCLSGYDEYSLLSLSSSDYAGLENLAIDLNNEFAPKEISISLPSQRADNFNIELARQLQTVRKSTLTFAPEAGSERLRKVINKNLDENQIVEAAISAYKAGWGKIKFYFIVGLPTETYEDLDAIIDLISKVKDEARRVKNEIPGIKQPLNITCTMSIFVPKPFTPFQWFEQLSTEELYNRKKYLLEKARSIKNLKMNFHDIFSSKLECLFSRGDRKLSSIIETAYRMGAYLDSWTENFSKDRWREAAIATGIDIEELTTQDYRIIDYFPWEIINVGVNREWLIDEYRNALEGKNITPCEISCTNCGVCVNLNIKPSYESRKEKNFVEHQSGPEKKYETKFRYRIKLTKQRALRYISHLDWFRMIYKATRRAKLPLVFSQGFNPAPKISIGMPLGLFIESKAEFMDVELTDKITEEDIKERLNNVLPDTCRVLDIRQIETKAESIAKIIHWAQYEAYEEDKTVSKIDFKEMVGRINNLLAQEQIIISKKTRTKTKELDIKPLINSIGVETTTPERLVFTISASQESMLKPEELINLFSDAYFWRIIRINLFDKDLKSL